MRRRVRRNQSRPPRYPRRKPANYWWQAENPLYLKEEIQARDDGIHRLVVYLQSPKFRYDRTVQVDDVLRRIQEIYI